tara:strand:+ start:81 stop:239 length:159 start_codon:yes stop_codon:yes gene_type:complete
MIFNTSDTYGEFELHQLLDQLGQDQGYTPEEWDEVLHDYSSSLLMRNLYGGN